MSARERVAVVGGGIAGLGAALFLARRGYPVEVFEKDPAALPPDLGGADGWHRRGTPQAGQSHAYVARCRQLLAAEAPDVLTALVESGVAEIRLDRTPPPTLTGPVTPDPTLVVLAARRPVFEWVLRRAVAREKGVRIHTGRGAAGLLVAGSGPYARARGVRLEDGDIVAADVVLDAAGARSPVGGWLDRLGLAPDVERVPCGISYCSRFFRLRAGRRPGWPGPLNRGWTAGGSFDRYSCLVFPADNGTFSITFGIHPEDRELRRLQGAAAFLAAARAIPLVAPWVDADVAEPLGPPATMHGLVNKRAPVAVEGMSVLAGLLAAGDAVMVTNPAHTRGTTLALLSGHFVAETLAACPGDPVAQARTLEAAYGKLLDPFYDDSLAQDAARLARWRPHDPRPGPRERAAVDRDGTVSHGEAFAAAQRDPVVWRAFSRAQQLLDPPAAALADPDVVARVRAVQASGWATPPPAAPGHDELAAAVADAAGRERALDAVG